MGLVLHLPAPSSALHPMAYPFDVPSVSFVWCSGAVEPLDDLRVESAVVGRSPVLAVGSNAAPSQLSRKFSASSFRAGGTEGTIPVVRAHVADLDVVYAAVLARYGSIPATAIHAKGTDAEVFVTWLTDNQLTTMHRSEGLGRAYHLAVATQVRSAGREIGPVPYYAASAGPLVLRGAPVGLAAVRCAGSDLRRLDQVALWSELARALRRGHDGRAYAAAVHGDQVLRSELTAFLHGGAPPRRPGGGAD